MGTINERFALIRKNSRLNVKQFATGIGLVATTVSSIENGSREPSKDALVRLNKIYHVDLNWMMTGEGDPYLTHGAATGLDTRNTYSQARAIADMAASADQLGPPSPPEELSPAVELRQLVNRAAELLNKMEPQALDIHAIPPRLKNIVFELKLLDDPHLRKAEGAVMAIRMNQEEETEHHIPEQRLG